MVACGGGFLDAPENKQYPKVVITTTALPDATVGTAYTFKMAATGGSGTDFLWAVQSGTLPAGLKFDLDGLLSGTPTTAGTATLTITTQHTCNCVPQNAAQSDSKVFTLAVH